MILRENPDDAWLPSCGSNIGVRVRPRFCFFPTRARNGQIVWWEPIWRVELRCSSYGWWVDELFTNEESAHNFARREWGDNRYFEFEPC